MFQSLVGLFVHSAIVDYNYRFGWASVVALQLTGFLTIFYEIFDLFVGWEGYWKNDRIMIAHHVATVYANWLMLKFIDSDDELISTITRDVMYWALLSNVTSIFNAWRILICGIYDNQFVKVFAKGVFAVVFCSLRSLQTIGMLGEIIVFYETPFINVVIFFWIVFTVMNVYWIHSVARVFCLKFKELMNGNTKEKRA